MDQKIILEVETRNGIVQDFSGDVPIKIVFRELTTGVEQIQECMLSQLVAKVLKSITK